jgi:hypothetical protein
MAKLIIKYQTTRDRLVGRYNDQGTLISWDWIPEPPGDGWVISDASGDYDTRWRRVLLVEDEHEDAQ